VTHTLVKVQCTCWSTHT